MVDRMLLVLDGPDAYVRRLVAEALGRLPGTTVILGQESLGKVDFQASFEDLFRARGEHQALYALQTSLNTNPDRFVKKLVVTSGPRRCTKCNHRSVDVTRCQQCGSDRLEPVNDTELRGSISAANRKAARARRRKR